MIVVDASVVAAALAVADARGTRARIRLVGERLHAPEVIDLEVASVLRRALAGGRLDEHHAAEALDELAMLPLARARHASLLRRVWELRPNLDPTTPLTLRWPRLLTCHW